MLYPQLMQDPLQFIMNTMIGKISQNNGSKMEFAINCFSCLWDTRLISNRATNYRNIREISVLVCKRGQSFVIEILVQIRDEGFALITGRANVKMNCNEKGINPKWLLLRISHVWQAAEKFSAWSIFNIISFFINVFNPLIPTVKSSINYKSI